MNTGGDPANRQTSVLAHQIEELTRDLDWTLAHFPFVANATTLVAECDIAHSPGMSVASCRAMPQLALAFVGSSSDLLATYATFLADPGSEVWLLVDEAQRCVVEAAFEVLNVEPLWQMVFQGIPESLHPGRAVELEPDDFPAMQALAKAEKTQIELLTEDPFSQGPAFGIWEKKRLVAMAMTDVRLPGAAKIGNLITREDYRRQGYATEVVSALVRALTAEDLRVFTLAAQTNLEAITLAESLGFIRERPMYHMRCVLKETEEPATNSLSH